MIRFKPQFCQLLTVIKSKLLFFNEITTKFNKYIFSGEEGAYSHSTVVQDLSLFWVFSSVISCFYFVGYQVVLCPAISSQLHVIKTPGSILAEDFVAYHSLCSLRNDAKPRKIIISLLVQKPHILNDNSALLKV